MDMFCFQCEQAAGGKGCTKTGMCGKSPEVAALQDRLTEGLVGLARAVESKTPPRTTDALVMESLFATLTNVNFDETRIRDLIQKVDAARKELGGAGALDPGKLLTGDVDTVSLRSTLLFGLRGMAAYASHALVLGKEDKAVKDMMYRGLRALGEEHDVNSWLGLLMELGQANLKCMALLDEANRSAFGTPAPTQVSLDVEKGPFIIVTGHDLLDLKQLLDQTKGKGINIYTHGEMLPAHSYPELKKYSHLKGNFGTAWQNQQDEFDGIPGAILFTTNCLMPPKPSYSDRAYTTAAVGYPGLTHVKERDGKKDFAPLIKKALQLGGWTENKQFTGINGGRTVMTGFGREAVLSVAPKVIEAVKSGAIKHFFLVGGCDGAKPGRNYYTEFCEEGAQGKYSFDTCLREIQIQRPGHRLNRRPTQNHGRWPMQRRLFRDKDRSRSVRCLQGWC